jgi:hypothetical protein
LLGDDSLHLLFNGAHLLLILYLNNSLKAREALVTGGVHGPRILGEPPNSCHLRYYAST